jgi:hypothetical protein
MTNLHLYLAVGLPVFATVVALVVNLVQITGIKTDVKGLRSEVNTKLDMILVEVL